MNLILFKNHHFKEIGATLMLQQKIFESFVTTLSPIQTGSVLLCELFHFL